MAIKKKLCHESGQLKEANLWSMDRKFASFISWHNFFLIAIASTDQKFKKKRPKTGLSNTKIFL